MSIEKKRYLIIFVSLFIISAFVVYKALFFVKEKYHYLRDGVADIEEFTKNNIRHYDFDYSWVENNKLVAHAFGGKGTKTYTNSLEAFEYNYDLGHRVFEVDFDLSTDGITICSHDENYWRYISGNEDSDIEYTYENFKNSTLFNDYKPLDYMDIIDLLIKYPDIFIITDTKFFDEISVYKQFSQLVEYAKKKSPEVLERLIPQIYTKEMLNYVMNVYEFKSVIFTLYQTEWEREDLAKFCYRSGVRFITISEDKAAHENFSFWKSLNIYTAVHTINDQEKMNSFAKRGVDVFYTDYLLPEIRKEKTADEKAD